MGFLCPTLSGHQYEIDFGTFNGNISAKKFKSWITEIDNYYTAFEFDDSIFVPIVISSFTKYAADWWDNLGRWRGKHRICTWRELKQELRKEFLVDDTHLDPQDFRDDCRRQLKCVDAHFRDNSRRRLERVDAHCRGILEKLDNLESFVLQSHAQMNRIEQSTMVHDNCDSEDILANQVSESTLEQEIIESKVTQETHDPEEFATTQIGEESHEEGITIDSNFVRDSFTQEHVIVSHVLGDNHDARINNDFEDHTISVYQFMPSSTSNIRLDVINSTMMGVKVEFLFFFNVRGFFGGLGKIRGRIFFKEGENDTDATQRHKIDLILIFYVRLIWMISWFKETDLIPCLTKLEDKFGFQERAFDENLRANSFEEGENDVNAKGNSFEEPITLLLNPMGFDVDKKQAWVTRLTWTANQAQEAETLGST